ncbi:MASE3 domain-containing protein [Neobacillus sp. LXY-4]|uniref:MASE3 domain-containing protein n=1 Tax=Neobacillus sp. LXY-4 TaxID=3379826 RepID=UPI003EDF20D6
MLKPALTEGKFLVYTLFSVMLLVTIHFFHPQLCAIYNPKNFLSFHIILEFFAIAISFSIFLYGWKKHKQTRSGKLLLLSLLFFIIGMTDLLHTVTFKGMPIFITESSVAKATWFWVIARTFEAVSMLLILFLPERKLIHDPWKILFLLSISLVLFIGFIVFYFENSLPLLVIEGEGTTLLKNIIEYFVCFLRIASIVVALLFYNEKKNQDFLYLALAFTILFLSELIFTIYQSIYDIDNFSGHLFKAVGYFFILKGFYYSIEKETLSGNYYWKNTFQLNDLVREFQGIFFTFKKSGEMFVHLTCDGELLYELGLDPGKVAGKTIFEIFPSRASMIEEHYRQCWDTGTNVSFHFPFNEKQLFMSLKPLYRDHELVEVLGTVIDVSNIDESHHKLHRYALS